ncbi:AAA family ATPase [Pelagibacterium luteolum]|uniref:Chromosome partitioning protein n=1 Tax=Pelagibacterium luteolum TaxID=440168 RepID=A0A1G8AEX6_9HYPH|nr:AAA family ATPase [Pelagibacterium luteolum]SDH19427.1 chromosome partitioning protein [Pelagibacterium luteolum]
MITVALCTQKGGTGKTTIATALAVAAHLAGKKSALLDLDPQTNAVNWFDRREGDGPDVASIQPGAIRRSLDAYRSLGMDWVFIDTPGKMDSASTEAAKYADMVLIPTQAQIFAIDTLEPLKRLLDMAGNPPAFVVLNLVHPNAGGRAADDAAAITARFNVAVAPIHMSRLKAYEDAPALGQTPQELEPQGRAAQEVAGLFTFLSEQASMIAGNHERIKA